MEVNPVSATTQTTAGGSVTGFADDFDTFLSLLVTQLQYQDPLSPLDATEFTSQLVQFTSVEQSINTNTKLDQLIGLQSAAHTVSAVNWLGTRVEATGVTAALENGQAEYTYTLGAKATSTTITIRNESGQVVRTLSGETDAGKHHLQWDGLNDQGVAQPDGLYTISVSAVDTEDDSVTVTTSFFGRVSGVSTENGEMELDVDGITVPIDSVISIEESPTA